MRDPKSHRLGPRVSLGEHATAYSSLRADRVRAGWADLAALTPGEIGRLLGQHDEDVFAAPCVHADAFGYGTRSSAILLLGETWDDTQLWWAEGRPCVTPIVDRTSLLHDLARR